MYTFVIKRRKDGRIITFSFVIAISILFVLMGLNTNNPDYSYYEGLFNRAKNGVTAFYVETGFWILVKMAVKIGMSYGQFLAIYTAIGLCLIGNSLILYTKKPTLALLCYFCYPFFLDLVQIRHFMAMAIFIYSTRYLLSFSKKNLFKYCFFIFLASTQHMIALAFLMFIVLYIQDIKKILYFSFFLTIGILIGRHFIYNSMFIQNLLAIKGREYSSGASMGQTIMYPMFFLFLVAFSYYLYFFNRENPEIMTDIQRKLMIKMCVTSVIFIPFILIDFQYTRLFRICIPIIYMYISDQISLLKRNNRIIANAILLIVVLLVNIKLFGKNSGYYETIIKPVFSNNLLFESLN